MNPLAQVRHLLVNDVRRLRWMLGGYVACVLLATIDALSFSTPSPGWLEITPVLVFLTGFLVVASAVQADSPYRPDAFWVSRPIEPAAVLGAKLVLAMLVLALPVMGLTWALVRIGLPSGDYIPAIGPASLNYASWLLLGMALAGVTKDLRSVANALVGLVVFSLVGMQVLLGRSGSNFGPSVTAAALVTALIRVGPLAVLAFVYLRRDAVKRARVFGGALLGLWFIAVQFSAPMRTGETEVMTIRPDDAPQVSVVLDRAAPGEPLELLRFHVGAKPWRDADRIVVTVSRLLVHARDGTTIQLNRVPAVSVILHDPVPDGLAFRDFAGNASFALTLSEGELRRLESGIESVDVIGNAEPFVAHVTALMPFASGAKIQQGGRLIQLDSVQRDHSVSSAVATTVAVRTTESKNMAREAELGLMLPRILLLDDSARTAVRMYNPSTRASSGSMVLFGIGIDRAWTHLESTSPARARTMEIPVGPARLMYLEWKSLGRAELHLRAERQ